MPNRLLVSVAEAAYVIYMLNYFKTTKNFEKGHCCEKGEWCHPMGDSTVPTSKVCPNGKKVSYPFAAYLVLRNAYFDKTVNYVVLAGGAAMSLKNKNVFVYLLPDFFVELFII